MTQPTFHIVFALFPGVTHLDFTGPQQFLCRLPGGQVTMASPDGADIEADGLTFTNLTRTYHLGVTSTTKDWKGRSVSKKLGKGTWLVVTRQFVPGGFSAPAYQVVRV